MNHYLVYWKPETVVSSKHLPLLRHSASNQYAKVAPGDVLWIVTSENPDDSVLVGRQRVDRIVDELEAKAILGVAELWPAEFHALSDHPKDKLNLVISRHARELKFDSKVSQLPTGFSGRHLQRMRRLDHKSIQLLDRLWNGRDDLVDQSPSTDRDSN